MEVTRTTVAILAAACVTAGVAGGYLATRDSAPSPAVSAEMDHGVAPEGVEATEGSIGESGVGESNLVERDAVRSGVIEARKPVRSVTPTAVARGAAPTPKPAVAPARHESTAAPRPESHASVPSPAPAAAPSSGLSTASATAPTELVTIAPAPIEAPRPAPEAEPIHPAEPARPEYHELVLAADSVIGLQVETAVNSETAKIEDAVTARVTRDVKIGDQVAIPAGSKARGEVTLVEKGGKLRERAKLGVRFSSIVLADGTHVPISTETIYREGDAPTRESAAKIGGGAIGGAIIGGILGGAKGVAIGSAIGGGAGSAAVMAGGRNPATLSPGSPVTIRLEQPATVTIEK
jgi:hypothetical protein